MSVLYYYVKYGRTVLMLVFSSMTEIAKCHQRLERFLLDLLEL